MLIAMSISILAFFTINVAELGYKSNIYWVLALSGFIMILSGKMFLDKKGKLNFPNAILLEAKSLFFTYSTKIYTILFITMFIISVFLFFSISNSTANAIVASPSFSVLQITPEVNAILVMFAALAEDVFFWGFLLPFVAGLLLYISNSKWLSVGLALIIIPLIFMGYHIGVYGSDAIALQFVFFFGLIATLYTIVFKNLFFTMIHMTNNVAITLFSAGQSSSAYVIFGILTIIVIIVSVIFLKRNGGKKNERS